ncbi:MAG: HAD-IC family P-type ATPase [Gammaproteobacteria bacterium]|nr:HAD-IC family P-type ATPase [Gammaproteobacteria bacterium]
MLNEVGGLTDAEVQARIARGEVNQAAMPTSRTVLAIVRANVLTRFNAILGTLFLVILMTGPWQDALFGGVFVLNTLIGIVQELRAKWTLDRLALVSQPKARVLRSGQIVDIATSEIVLDDILILVSGDQVVVDGVMLDAAGLEVDESLLTGESAAVPKRPGDEVLSGSFVVAGTGRCRATRVGVAAYGQGLASEAKRFRLAHSELRAGTNRILRYVTWAIVPTAALLFAGQFAIRAPVAEALLYSAAGVVAMVPEGLVLLTSVALALGALRLARQRTLVQDLPATETLARVDVICLDKTGTLTEREPRFEEMALLGQHPDAVRALASLVAADPKPNATLLAIGRAYQKEPHQAITAFVPFSSARKWSGATLDGLGTWVLGAPDVLLAEIPEADATRRRAEEHARAGQRVLLLARTDSTLPPDRLPDRLEPAALALLTEQIRGDAAETLRYFDAQGVAIKLLSGDHPATVGQVASQLGIGNDNAPVDARELPQDAEALARLAETRSVFGRLSPQQKQSLVASLQANGHVVAMVGDGVNDVLALKRADIGIAMGAGASASRAVAHLVLLDNRFARLPSVIAEGRRVIGNVERLAALFLTKTVYAMLLALAVGVADVTFPFLPRHLTLVGSLTIGIPAFFLSLERSAERARPGFVGRVLRFTVPAGLFVASATFAAYALIRTYSGGSLGEARTAATVTLFAVASWVLFMVARPLKPTRWLVLGGMISAFLLVLIVPPLREFFALEPLPTDAWLAVTAIATAAAGVLHWSAAVAAKAPVEAMKTRPITKRDIVNWLLSADSPKWFLFAAAVLVIGGAWLFFGVLEDIISHDPLVNVDVYAYHLLQSLRMPALDSMMIAFTELGDAQVLLPVILVALAWFLIHRLWLTAGYWLVAIGGAEVLAKVLKVVLHRPRPGLFHGGIEQFSFPSGHATMSVVVYGFLAFLLCRRTSPGLRKAVISVSAALVTLIALSRLYLGVHWLSDVLGSLAFGVAWIAALAIAYEYQSHERFRTNQLAATMLATLIVAGGAHISSNHKEDCSRYAPQPNSMAHPRNDSS